MQFDPARLVSTSASSPRWPSLTAASAVLLLMLVRIVYFYMAPDASLIAVIPDDAFYYLQLAKHRLSEGRWTFDGTSPATGFHLLYGYLLVGVYAVVGDLDWRQIYLLVSIAAAIAIAAGAYLTCRSVEALYGRNLIPLALAPFATGATLAQSTAMMESWLVLLFSALTVHAVVRNRLPSRPQVLALAGIGVLGSLARSDYGMLPGALFCAALAARSWVGKEYARRTLWLLAGAIAGVLLGAFHNHLVSGSFLQASAQTKLYWSATLGHSLSPALLLWATAAIPFLSDLERPVKVVLGVLLLCAVGARFALVGMPRHWKEERTRSAVLVGVACAATLVGYVLFYRHNSAALQIWYCANFTVPIAMVLACAVFLLGERRSLPIAVIGLALYGGTGVSTLLRLEWPHQLGMMRAGMLIRNQPGPQSYGAWNAGIVSYFSGKRIVNIDGLTNDDLLPYIQQNRLFEYIVQTDLSHLVDYELMLHDPLLRKRGGYADERFDRCVEARQTLDGDAPAWVGTRLRLYEVIRGCR